MDEFDKLRSAYPEQPAPTRDVIQQARSQVQTLAREAAGQPAPRSRRFTPLRVGMGLTSGAAAATVAALAVPLMLSPDAGPADSAPPATTTAPATAPALALTASQVLVAAAVEQERSEATTGKYFRVRTLWESQLKVGRGSSAYMLNLRKVSEVWTGGKGSSRWYGSRDVGARPATPADETKWRQAGSPTSWNLGPSDSNPPRDYIVSSKPTKGELTEVPGRGDRYEVLGGWDGVSAAEVRALPTEPAALRKRMLADNAHRAPAADDRSFLVSSTHSLLMDSPAPPKVRGAGLRLLAGLPGAVVERGVKDPMGRTGTAVTFTLDRDKRSVRLIIEPSTGKLLSSRRWGFKAGSRTVLTTGWTDQRPRIPAATIR